MDKKVISCALNIDTAIRAVWKTGNTPSISLFSKLSAEEKSLATGSRRIVRCRPREKWHSCLFLSVDHK